MMKFRQALENCCSRGVDHRGDIYTRSNNESFMKEWLDRTLSNQAWTSIYNKYHKQCAAVWIWVLSTEGRSASSIMKHAGTWKMNVLEKYETEWRKPTSSLCHMEKMNHLLNRCSKSLTKWNDGQRKNQAESSKALNENWKHYNSKSTTLRLYQR